MSLKRFGLFSYTDTHNLGDEIQSIAARQFLPRVDYYLDREHLSTFFPPKGESVALIMNAWYSHHPENWPPSEIVVPLLIAMHI
ncbi:MAG: hypothetical protein J0H67_19750, partial [Rhodospirillales bacterium]|nr:hypothetical protein [Rhodospirillales bacterium]